MVHFMLLPSESLPMAPFSSGDVAGLTCVSVSLGELVSLISEADVVLSSAVMVASPLRMTVEWFFKFSESDRVGGLWVRIL